MTELELSLRKPVVLWAKNQPHPNENGIQAMTRMPHNTVNPAEFTPKAP